jgi:hypothetical protein
MAMDEIRVQIFSDFAPSYGLRNAFKSWGYGKTEYKNMKIVDDDNYTHAVIINHGTPTLKVSKDKVIGLMHEPFEILNSNNYLSYIKDNIGTYICHDKSKFPDWPCFQEGICYLAPQVPIYNEIDEFKNVEKTHRMSIIASDKTYFSGHALRHEIIKRILRTNLDIHIYGRGSHFYPNDSRVKGPIDHKPNAFLPYQYSIAIENASYRYWVTEKFYDPILCNSVPIYWGASEISNIFTDQSHINLTGKSVDDMMDIIINVYKNGSSKNYNIAKELLRGNKNFAHYLWEKFSNV